MWVRTDIIDLTEDVQIRFERKESYRTIVEDEPEERKGTLGKRDKGDGQRVPL